MFGTGDDGTVLASHTHPMMFRGIEFQWYQPDPPLRAPLIAEVPHSLCVVDSLERVNNNFFMAWSNTSSEYRGILTNKTIDLPYIIKHPNGGIWLMRESTMCDINSADCSRWTLVLYRMQSSRTNEKKRQVGRGGGEEEEEEGGRRKRNQSFA